MAAITHGPSGPVGNIPKLDSFRPWVNRSRSGSVSAFSVDINAEEPNEGNGSGDNDGANIKPTRGPGEAEVNRRAGKPNEEKHEGDGQQNRCDDCPVCAPIETWGPFAT